LKSTNSYKSLPPTTSTTFEAGSRFAGVAACVYISIVIWMVEWRNSSLKDRPAPKAVPGAASDCALNVCQPKLGIPAGPGQLSGPGGHSPEKRDRFARVPTAFGDGSRWIPGDLFQQCVSSQASTASPLPCRPIPSPPAPLPMGEGDPKGG